MNNLIVVLGGRGRLGTALINHLSESIDNSIISVDRLSLDTSSLANIDLVYDINEKALIYKLEELSQNEKIIVINASGLQHSNYTKDIEISNLLSPIQFIKNMRDSNLNFFFVHISSISVTHGNDINPKLGEGNPINYYGLTKLKFESFLSRFMPSNSFIVLRPGAFYGKSYNNKNFDKFLDLIKRGIFIFPFKKRYRSYTNIDTIFSAIQIIINEIKEESKLICKISNITDMKPLSTLDLFLEFKEKKKHKFPPVFFPSIIFKILSRVNFFVEKRLKIHIGFLTMFAEQGYDFNGDIDQFFKDRKILRYETNFEF